MPCVGKDGAAGFRPGRARKEDPGVPPPQGLADNGPLGPELRAIGAPDGGRPDKAVCALVKGVPRPVLGPGKEVLEAQSAGHSPSSGARAQSLLAQPRHFWGVGNTWVAWPYHHRSRARPWCRRRSREVGGPCPRPRPRPRPRGPHTTRKKCSRQVAGWKG